MEIFELLYLKKRKNTYICNFEKISTNKNQTNNKL